MVFSQDKFMQDNIFNSLFNALDLNYDFKEEYKFRNEHYAYFIELALAWSFKLFDIKRINEAALKTCYKLEFYFEQENMYDLFLDKDIINKYLLNFIDMDNIDNLSIIDDVILKINRSNILQYIYTKCDKFSLSRVQELSKFFVLNQDFLCIYFLKFLKSDKAMDKFFGFFNPKIGIFKRQSPKEYLKILNDNLYMRKYIFDKFNSLPYIEAEKKMEQELPFKNVAERIWWYKFMNSKKPIMSI